MAEEGLCVGGTTVFQKMVEPDTTLAKYVIHDVRRALVKSFTDLDSRDLLRPEDASQDKIFEALEVEFISNLDGGWLPGDGYETKLRDTYNEMLKHFLTVFNESFEAARKVRTHMASIESEAIRDAVGEVFRVDADGPIPNMPAFLSFLNRAANAPEGWVIKRILPYVDPDCLDEDEIDAGESGDDSDDSSNSANEDASLGSNDSSSADEEAVDEDEDQSEEEEEEDQKKKKKKRRREEEEE